MGIELQFFGGARNVTGSSYVVAAGGRRFLVDCGFYQERNLKSRNWDPFPFEPGSLDAVLLTHAHLDHCGLLPRLVREGFAGKIHCTPATADIAKIVMLDAARIQTEDAKFKRRRHAREGRESPHPVVPLYTVEDAEEVFPHLAPLDYEQEVDLGNGVAATFHDAGHILGSSMIRLAVANGGSERTLVFSGDVGRWGTPILRDPTVFDAADYVVCESTYGDRLHKDNSTVPEDLARIINETRKAGGNIVIPSFAIERSQELLYRLNELLEADRIPHLMVFLDSPMAIRVTEVFKRHPELFDSDTLALMDEGRHPCDFPGLHMSRTVAESKAINHIRGTSIVIAGSGMCTGGRIKHHLINNISRPDSTVLFVGYQASGTLGRIILEGTESVRIHGEKREIAARVEKINGFSAHADRDELFRWLSGLKQAPRNVYVTHGEEESAKSFGEWLAKKTGWSCTVPTYGDREECV